MSKRTTFAVAISTLAVGWLAPGLASVHNAACVVLADGTRIDVGSNRDAPIVGSNNPNINPERHHHQPAQSARPDPLERRRPVRRPIRRRPEPEAASTQPLPALRFAERRDPRARQATGTRSRRHATTRRRPHPRSATIIRQVNQPAPATTQPAAATSDSLAPLGEYIPA